MTRIKAMIGGWRPRNCGGALWETTSIVGDKSASQFLETCATIWVV